MSNKQVCKVTNKQQVTVVIEDVIDTNVYSTESEPPITAQSEPLNFRFLEWI